MNYGTLPNGNYQTGEIPEYNEGTIRNKNNIKGWYFYSFSSEPFVVSAVATYIPLLLEHFARINGVTLEDHSIQCTSDHNKCVLGIFNGRLYIDTSSFALYTFSLSVLFQTFLVISVSGIVDVWKTVEVKRNMLILFGFIGSLSTIYVATLHTSQYYTLALLAILSNSCYGVVNVVGNSLLPSFVSESLESVRTNADDQEMRDIDTETTLVSGRGASIGYFSALLVQIFSIGLIRNSKSKENIQIAVLLVGLWWLVWQLPILWLMRDPPRTSIENSMHSLQRSLQTKRKWRHSLSYFKYGWLSLFEALKHARLLKDVVIFLFGWFIVSDSITTINSTAILFSKTELKMGTLNLIVVSILTMVNAILGAFIIPQYISKSFHFPPEKILIYIICWASVIPFYGILGFVFKNIGLKHQFEMYITAIWYGFALGGLSAVSRSVFSLIIPKGRESTFFSLFSVTDKGSSVLGPFLIALITDRTHNIRNAFYLLFGLLVLAIPIFGSLDVARGKHEAELLCSIQASPEEEDVDDAVDYEI